MKKILCLSMFTFILLVGCDSPNAPTIIEIIAEEAVKDQLKNNPKVTTKNNTSLEENTKNSSIR